MNAFDRVGPAGAWLATLAASLCLLGGGAVLAPRTFWDGFLWRYFWGPVAADARDAACAINDGGTVTFGGRGFADTCAAAVERGALVVDPGYTVVSEVGYLLAGLFFLAGVYLLLSRLHLGHDRRLVVALTPFVAFGGALRVVEDVDDAVSAHRLDAGTGTEAASAVIDYPLSALLVSPVLYLTVSLLAFLALLGSVALSRRDVVASYHRTLAATGTALLVVALAGLLVVALTHEAVGFHPLFLTVAVVAATLLAGAVYALTDRVSPQVLAGTGYVGLLVLWAHALESVTNVLVTDWAVALGLPRSSPSDHLVGEVVVRVTAALQPDSLTAAVGAAWPYLVLKLAVAWAVVWLFSERAVDDDPRLAHLLLVAVIALGLGPGTRALLRATFAV